MNLIRFALKRAAKKPAPDRIPLSGSRIGLDCYSVYILGEGKAWSILLDQVCRNGPVGRWWNGEMFEHSCCVPWSQLKDATYEFTHYVGPHQFKHSTPQSFLVSELLNIYHFRVFRNQIEQFFFNHRHLVRANRMMALRHIMERTLEDQNYQISAVMFMTELYSDHWVFHPDYKKHLSHCTLLLDSLVESGDLKKVEISYSLLPKALTTHASYEEENTRHRDSLRQQRALSWLTFALVTVGVIQLVLSKWK